MLHRASKTRCLSFVAAFALCATAPAAAPLADVAAPAFIAADSSFDGAPSLHRAPTEERQLRRAFAVASLAGAWLLLRMGWSRLRVQRNPATREI